ncbi:P-loop containing nucleoside triphosphate hydrolase protein [Catenaria anguillulae PL171]|uniref:p-loop containing nucleoside triphosphate hydrolase protein n=1 Tax=Catenaria anguillulae PL171 TaxID=765915 RepID=A0A1Y2HNC5_9FUNG|nr:P-loop containing nucleoside triphosphate hydrolase protein [Catenaria anguillulae PL171]
MYSFLPSGKPKAAVQLFGDEDDASSASATGSGAPMSAKERRKAEKAAKAAAAAKKKPKSAASSSSSKKTSQPSTTTDQAPGLTNAPSLGDDAENAESPIDLPLAGDEDLGQITAMSQVSRFHEDTLETDPRDIILNTVCVSIGNKELLSDARLYLAVGVKYALIGMNGTGKSTLLKSIASKLMIGFPANRHVVMIDQHAADTVDSTQSALGALLASDLRYNTLKSDIADLERALHDANVDVEATKVVYSIKLRDAQERLREAQKIATFRSGARGKVAREDLLVAESELEVLMGAVNLNEYGSATEAMQLLEERYEEIAVYDEEDRASRAESILRGLGFTDETMSKPLRTMSGGWRMRAGIARALFLPSDILFCDEISNNLDLPAILWLQNFIPTLPQTVVMISHDRDFLDASCTELIRLKDKTLTYFDGNLTTYERAQREKRVFLERTADKIEKERQSVNAQIARNIKHAKATGNDKALSQAASRVKKLDRVGMQRGLDGKKIKRKTQVGYFTSARPQVVFEALDPTVTITLPPPSFLRATAALLQLDNVTVKYKSATQPAARNFTLSLDTRSRIALVGANGSGKSTIASVIAGTLPVTSGARTLGSGVKVGYMSQHMDLDGIKDKLLLDVVSEWIGADMDANAFLGSFGIGGLGSLTVGKLSGGQRAKLNLARAMAARPHVLVLDEPSNHLDMASIVSLTRAIRAFEGAVVVVSHDVWFLKHVIEGGPLPDDDDEDEDTTVDEFADKLTQGVHQIIVMEDGEPTRVESMDEVIERIMSRGKKLASTRRR